ncbi:MAG: phage terminase small subunit P27 family [Hoeflea sp.]|nr:phage terminase small subunit P27 family [Hoeflea sp.]
MTKGRKPTPSHLKIVRGTNRADRGARNEPKPGRERPSAPADMSDRGRDAWGYVIGILDCMGVLTEADAMAVELMCEARADWLSARDAITAAGGETYKTEAGLIKAHPAVAMRNDAARRLQSLLAEFGMTPSSRSKVNAQDSDGKADPAAEYFA